MSAQPQLVQGQEQRSYPLALFLSILFGVIGADRFYLKRNGTAIVKFFTFGGCLIWWIFDIYLIAIGELKDVHGRSLKQGPEQNKSIIISILLICALLFLGNGIFFINNMSSPSDGYMMCTDTEGNYSEHEINEVLEHYGYASCDELESAYDDEMYLCMSSCMFIPIFIALIGVYNGSNTNVNISNTSPNPFPVQLDTVHATDISSDERISSIRNVRVRITAPPESWPLLATPVNVELDGINIHSSNHKKGIDVSVHCNVGSHELLIKMGRTILGPKTKWTLNLSKPGHYDISLKFSSFWAKYLKNSLTLSGPFHIVGPSSIQTSTETVAQRTEVGGTLAVNESMTQVPPPLPDMSAQPKPSPPDMSAKPKPSPPDMSAQLPNESITARFSVGELLAEGGMAQVFRATQRKTERTVVWKQAHGLHNPLRTANQKLDDEAELLRELHHHRIPAVLDQGTIEDGKGNIRSVLVMEFIEGGDLKNTVEQFKKMGVQLPIEKIVEIVSQICEPLEYMAALPEPIYHRDLKPHNIIVHPERGPILIDFGLAKMIATGSDVSVTRGGSGTWTPPERDSGVSGPYTDVWSLGKMLLYLLTNEVPPAILNREKTAQLLAKLGHPAWLSELIIWVTWPDHEQRVQSVKQFHVLLKNEGVWPDQQSVPSSASDDFTTWG